MLQKDDTIFLSAIHTCSQESSNIFEYAFQLAQQINTYLHTTSEFFIYSNGAWFNQHKQPAEEENLFDDSAYQDGIRVIKPSLLAFWIESYMSKIIICCKLGQTNSHKLKIISSTFPTIRNTMEKISRKLLANNFQHQIEHLKAKLHQTQTERSNAINEVYKVALELKDPLTSIQGYSEIIQASLPTTNQVLRSIHYYSDLVLSNTENIVKKINKVLKIDNLASQNTHPNVIKNYKYKDLTAIIADNWHDNATLLKIFLGTAGINCLSANSPEQIITLAKAHNPELILIDENIDNGQGIQTALLLRDKKFANKIIALTTNFKKQQQQLFFDAGFDAIIAKPLDKAELFTIIEKFFTGNNLYANKNSQEIALAEQISNNTINYDSSSEIASRIFIKNINFNINALINANKENDLISIKKIVNIIRRTSGSIGLLDMSVYADMIYKALENNDQASIASNLTLLLTEMKNLAQDQKSKQIS